MPKANPNNTSIVILPTIACLNVIHSGLFPKDAEIDIDKHLRQYLINSHIVYILLKIIKN